TTEAAWKTAGSGSPAEADPGFPAGGFCLAACFQKRYPAPGDGKYTLIPGLVSTPYSGGSRPANSDCVYFQRTSIRWTRCSAPGLRYSAPEEKNGCRPDWKTYRSLCLR